MTSPRKQLLNLADALVEDIMSMSDEEILAEFLEDGGSLEELEASFKSCHEKAKRLASLPKQEGE